MTNFIATKICNLDETGNSTVHVPPKIICAKGIKQVGIVTSEGRGIIITMIVAVNAIGKHVCPVLIFTSVHFKNHMLTGASTASIGGANPTGWLNRRPFLTIRSILLHVKGFVRKT